MYTLYHNFRLAGQYNVRTWQQQGHPWAAFSEYRQPVTHGLYIPQPVLNLILSGRKRMYDGTKVHHLRAGDIFLIPAGAVICSEILCPQEDFVSINIVLPEEQLREYRFTPANGFPAGHTTALPRSPHWWKLSRQLYRDFHDNTRPDYQATIQQVLYLLQQEDKHILQLLTSSLPLPEMMEKLCRELQQVRQLDDVAAMGYMSTATLKRRFRRVYHQSPMQWVWEKRLQMAAFLLRTTVRPIPEIAYSSGFEDVTHFYRQFRHYYHLTPLQWRNGESDLFSK
ncbi:AraC family transcriptional regulator [Chitinophaga solisilvae]|uniref:AraC family transcriptional regulator n=1 Tax=Chitinophaga solisilvae TaxID=1233460 RepID=UPI00136A8B46|nr:helix-turn-helix domain-containing protein [Chitinophaga solisilvae]